MANPAMTTSQKSTKVGFDSAAKSREQDFLNRWQFAREIYGIATIGPNEWSVRIAEDGSLKLIGSANGIPTSAAGLAAQ
jgi:hypothetical protein